MSRLVKVLVVVDAEYLASSRRGTDSGDLRSKEARGFLRNFRTTASTELAPALHGQVQAATVWPGVRYALPTRREEERSRDGEPQKAIPNCARYVRGATKCVPEQVERKLKSATLLVTFRASNRKVQRTRSVWNRLSVPTPTLNRLRPRIRGGFVSSFSVPGAGILTSFVPHFEEGSQVVIGIKGVAT